MKAFIALCAALCATLAAFASVAVHRATPKAETTHVLARGHRDMHTD